MPHLLDGQPSLYESLLPAFFKNEMPNEDKATCSNCAMCASNAFRPVPGSSGGFFLEQTKCCTYYPSLPNYLVGAILSDESAENRVGRERVLQKIRERRGVTPLALNAPAKYNLLYKNSREFFGRSPSMRCPYYIEESGGLCGVWKYRESVCSTYFCKHVAGADGKKFWMSLKQYLSLAELTVQRFTTFKLFPEYLVGDLYVNDLRSETLPRTELEDEPPLERVYQKSWGPWGGMEVEFYKECFALTKKLTREEFDHAIGLDGAIALASLEDARAKAVAPKLPLKLKLNPDLKVEWMPDGAVVIGGYSELDALELGGESYTLLREFNGSDTVSATRARLREKHASDFSDELIRTFYHHRILVAPAGN